MPPRPDPRVRPRKAVQPDNGTKPSASSPTPLELAIEQVHVEARAAGLPPIIFSWQEGAKPDEQQSAAFDRLRRKFDDVEAIGTGPRPQSLDEIGEPDNSDSWLVEGFIRPGTTVMITGLPGAAKSWVARQLAMCAAVGRTFLDHYTVAHPLKVLILEEDNGEREEWRREEALFGFLELKRADMVNVWRLSLAGVELDQERWQRWIRGLIIGLGLDLIILDPVSEMHGGKELRDDPAFRSMLRFLKQLKVDYPTLATVLVHHNRKSQGPQRGAPSTIEDVRGQWGQTPDVVAIVRSLGERRIRWELLKRVPHSALILEQQQAGGLTVVADETTSQTRRQTTDGRVLGAIDSGARTVDEITIGTGLSRAGTYKALGRLHQAGLISKRAPYERLRDSDDPLFDELPDEPIE
jgi:hypothetical protein